MTLKPWFTECCPERRLDWQEVDRLVIVFRPRFGESRFGLALARLLGLEAYKIRLDEIGTLIWKHCDGKTPAREIAVILRDGFGDRVDSAEERLQSFLIQLRRARMINLRIPGEEDNP